MKPQMPTIGDQAAVRFVYPKPEVFSEKTLLQDVLVPSRASINYESAVFPFKEALYPPLPEGGILRVYHTCLFPEKGLPFPQAIHACNLSKRYLIELLKMFSKSKKLMIAAYFDMDHILHSFNQSADMNLRPFYYESEYPRYYSKACREMKVFIEVFLAGIGVSEKEAKHFAKVFITLVDQDSAYKYRIQDLAGTTTKEKLLNDFIGEFGKMFDTYKKRESPHVGGISPGMISKFSSVLNLAKYAWWIPKFRKAVKKGIAAMNWGNLVMDEQDLYHTMLWLDYNYQGLPFETRKQMFIDMHPKDRQPLMIRQRQQ